MKKFIIVSAVLAAVAFLAVPELPGTLAAGARSLFASPPPPEKTLTRAEYYRFDPASPLEDRIKPMPPELFAHYRDMDKDPAYAVYAPSAEDKALVKQYLSLLPDVYQKVLRERCLGIYFISNFKGNGITSWAEDKDGKIFFHLTLNPDSLKKGLSATLTERESSCFMPREGWSVKVDAGARYKGLLYALAHEASHGVDYVKGVTPWADNEMPASLRPASLGKTAIFFKPFWRDFYVTEKDYDFPLRDKITFYGLNGGPRIGFEDAAALYENLTRGPFASLYGSTSWAEDFAELATFHLLTTKLGQPYRIILTGPGVSRVFEPMKTVNVMQRAALVMNDIDPGGRHIPPSKETGADMKAMDGKMKAVDAELERARQLLEKGGKTTKSGRSVK
ncbi:MAG: hypothetical protein M0011_15680 [Elusimicrobia bacterium]|nr:hypothetical protein [Elusimicrobiota bacterium]